MSERRRLTDADIPMLYRQLVKIPVEPPCDVCPWVLYPNKYQGCDNAGCSFIITYFAVWEYQLKQGWTTLEKLNAVRGKSIKTSDSRTKEVPE